MMTMCRRPMHDVELTLEGMPDGRPLVTHYRVDADHSNAYEKWKKAGSPQPPPPRNTRCSSALDGWRYSAHHPDRASLADASRWHSLSLARAFRC